MQIMCSMVIFSIGKIFSPFLFLLINFSVLRLKMHQQNSMYPESHNAMSPSARVTKLLDKIVDALCVSPSTHPAQPKLDARMKCVSCQSSGGASPRRKPAYAGDDWQAGRISVCGFWIIRIHNRISNSIGSCSSCINYKMQEICLF